MLAVMVISPVYNDRGMEKEYKCRVPVTKYFIGITESFSWRLKV